jgi:hypothetical protein
VLTLDARADTGKILPGPQEAGSQTVRSETEVHGKKGIWITLEESPFDVYSKKSAVCRMLKGRTHYPHNCGVKHIQPHKRSKELFWDANNWQYLCTYHYNVKKAREDGGFGNHVRG